NWCYTTGYLKYISITDKNPSLVILRNECRKLPTFSLIAESNMGKVERRSRITCSSRITNTLRADDKCRTSCHNQPCEIISNISKLRKTSSSNIPSQSNRLPLV